MKKLTTAEFIERAKEKHGDRYDNSKVEYEGANLKTTIVCPDHGKFQQNPSHHLQGSGCRQCGVLARKQEKQEEFVARAKARHGDRYDYSKLEYKGADAKATIVCPDHGEFHQRAADHLRGIGCRLCGNLQKSQKTRMGLDVFIEKAFAKHGDQYDYSMVNFVNTKTRIAILCPEHGIFEQTPDVHLRGCGCPVCRYIKSGRANALKTDEFVSHAIAMHDDQYDYSLVQYVNQETPVVIICKEHGPFQQIPVTHIHQKAGCPLCMKEKMRRRFRKTRATFIKEARMLHGDKYDYSRVDYQTAVEPVTIICPDHGPFRQIPASHLFGAGCRDCAYQINGQRSRTSKEEFIKRCAEKHGGKYRYDLADYQGSAEKIRIICPEHGEFEQLAGDHLAGRGCVYCQESGFRRDKPATLYYIRVRSGSELFWKIGITNRAVAQRFEGQDLDKIDIVETWSFDSGVDALDQEQEILD